MQMAGDVEFRAYFPKDVYLRSSLLYVNFFERDILNSVILGQGQLYTCYVSFHGFPLR